MLWDIFQRLPTLRLKNRWWFSYGLSAFLKTFKLTISNPLRWFLNLVTGIHRLQYSGQKDGRISQETTVYNFWRDDWFVGRSGRPTIKSWHQSRLLWLWSHLFWRRPPLALYPSARCVRLRLPYHPRQSQCRCLRYVITGSQLTDSNLIYHLKLFNRPSGIVTLEDRPRSPLAKLIRFVPGRWDWVLYDSD